MLPSDSPPIPRQRVSAVDIVAAPSASAGLSASAGPSASTGSSASAAPSAAQGPEDTWQSTADNGWKAAAAAAEPVVTETTRSGLPIRTPQANLVPGSVSESAPARVRRTPEQVQGLLSAYTRGVQRGRDDLQTTAQNEEH